MKIMILNFGYFLMLFIFSLCIISIAEKETIKNEVNEALSCSIRETMEVWEDDNSIGKEELIDIFLDNYAVYINSKTNNKFSFYTIDTERGLMDVEVLTTFKYPNTCVGTITTRKTIIYDN